MNHLLTLFLVPENSLPQAVLISPPAHETPAKNSRDHCKGRRFRFMAGIVADAAGFGLLLTGCWFSLQLMSAFLL